MFYDGYKFLDIKKSEYRAIEDIINNNSMSEGINKLKEFIKSKILNQKVKEDNETITLLAKSLYKDYVNGYLKKYVV